MSTKSKAVSCTHDDAICQGDVFKNVKYSFIDSEDDTDVNIVELEFPLAIIISQACDVIAMNDIIENKTGKPAKFMPSILLCPIYEKEAAKKGIHIEDYFSVNSIALEQESVYQKDDYKVSQRDWHYRYHALTIELNKNIVIDNAIIDFKHYFTVPMSYLVAHKDDRLFRVDDLFAEQITLKFSKYLSIVAIP